jgi:predicted P-loop ATPase
MSKFTGTNIDVSTSINNVPQYIKNLTQWIVWGKRNQKGVVKLDKDGKLSKLPYNPTNGSAAKSNDSSTWATFHDAVNAFNMGMYNGIGFVFHPQDNLVCIDLDDCFDADGNPTPETQKIIGYFSNTFIEYSPSKNGLHIICGGLAIATGKGTQNKWIEIYGGKIDGKHSARYFCLTGLGYPENNSEIVNCQAPLAWLHDTFKKAKEKPKPNSVAHSKKSAVFSTNGFDEAQKIQDALGCISPDDDYEQWLQIGMALHANGCSVDIWDNWSAGGSKYKSGQCQKKWASFNSNGIGIGSLFEFARTNGYEFPKRPQTESKVWQPSHENKTKQYDNATTPNTGNIINDLELQTSYTKSGIKVKNSVRNLTKILENHPNWLDVMAYNEFSIKTTKQKLPPYPHAKLGDWTDNDNINTINWLSDNFNFEPSDLMVQKVAVNVADKNTINPVRDYLLSLVWDGRPRVTNWLEQYMGAKESPANRVFQKCFLIGAVARIMEPGCKCDTVLILEGEQGTMKSTTLEALFSTDWFTDAAFDLGTMEGFLVMRGNWCVELAELDKMKKADASKAKTFFGQRIDRYKPPYGRNVIDVPRQCVFAGTVNEHVYLTDPSGGRRYMPVSVKKYDINGIKRDRNQIWAEAVQMYKLKEKWHFDASLQYIQEAQDNRFDTDPWEDVIVNYLAMRDINVIHSSDIFTGILEMSVERIDRMSSNRVKSIMQHLGWKKGVYKIDGKRLNGYQKTLLI